MKKVLPFLLIGGGVLFAGMAFNTKQAVERLQYRNPRLRFKKITLSGIYLDVELDITNPASSSIPIEYFTGDIYYSGNKLSSFTFDGNKNNISIKARTTTRVPFTIVISSIGALQTLTKLYKALIAGTKIDTVMSVSAMMYAAGLDIPVNFSYDFKSNQVNGIGRLESQQTISEEIENYFTSATSPGPKERQAYAAEVQKFSDYTQKLTKAYNDVKITVAQNEIRFKYNNGNGFARIALDPVRKEILLPKLKAIVRTANQVSGIGSCKATLEFGSNAEMEKYFTGKRIDKKIMFSKN